MLLVHFDRAVPEIETEAVSEFLLHLLTGNINRLPPEALVHKFWTFFEDQHKQTSSYWTCLRKDRLTNVTCYHDIKDFCGSRFGQRTPERLEQCRLLLANKKSATTMGVNRKIARMFVDYHSCFQSYRRRVNANCTEMLRKAITGRRLRATKVTRAMMNSMGPLLRSLPTLRVIHLVRDPRAVALSRIYFFQSGRGIFTESNWQSRSSRSRHNHTQKSESKVVQEASLYCHHVTADIRSRLALEREFPGRILSVRYEDVLANPEQRFRDIYKFIDEPMPNTTFDKMQRMGKKGQTKHLSTKWQNSLRYTEGAMIARQCAEYFRLLNISSTETYSRFSILILYAIISIYSLHAVMN